MLDTVRMCGSCPNGEYRGYPPKGSPEWEVGTVRFWCPIKRHHDRHGRACEDYETGEPAKIDKYGRPLTRIGL